MRLLDANPSTLKTLSKTALLEGIRLSEGRLVTSEIVVTTAPMVDGVSNPELAAAFGADLLLLNVYDVDQPMIAGMPSEWQTLGDLKAFTGRPVGLNLEPSDLVSPGRRATPENAKKAVDQGADFIVLTGNPGTMVSNEGILTSLKAIAQAVGDEVALVAGRMHGAGVGGRGLTSTPDLQAFVAAGADIVLVPAPGTLPGTTIDAVRQVVLAIQAAGALAMTAIGTSQEGADEATIRQIALGAKMAGSDLHHIGDAGYSGVAVPENIMAYCLAVKGRRHTYRRMALSQLR